MSFGSSPTGSALIAERMDAAFAHRTWTIGSPDSRARCRLFFVVQGRAALTAADAATVELTGPFLLWLPRHAKGAFRLNAGGEGAALTIADDFVLRIVGDSPVAAHLRPLLDRTAIASAERIARQLAELTGSFTALVRESRDQQPAFSAMMGLHLGLVLLHLWRAAGVGGSAPGRHGTAATTVQRFRQLAELHYRETLGIGDFARLLGVTRAHLHDACVRTTGRTPLDIVHDRLLAEARLMLEQTELMVEQIGYSLGFRDPGYFNRFFKRLTGQSPGAFRRAAATRPPGEAPSFAAWP